MCVAIEEACKTMLSPTLWLTIAKQSKRNMLTLQPQWAKVATANDMSHEELVDLQVL